MPYSIEKDTDELLNKQQLAAKLLVSQATINNWTAADKIPYIRIGGVIRFSWPRVRQALEAYAVKELTGEPTPPTRPGRPPARKLQEESSHV